MRLRPAIVAAIVLAFAPAVARADTTTTVHRGCDPADGTDIMIISEGYTPAEMPRFRATVAAIASQLLTTTPYREYSRLWNLHAVEIPAGKSGICAEGTGSALGTKLKDTTPDLDPRRVFDIARHAGKADVVVILVNHWFRAFALQRWCFVSELDSPASVAVHELGHALGFLLDEYEEFPAARWDFLAANEWVEGSSRFLGWGANVTVATKLEDIPWRHWIPRGTPIPTPRASGHATGLYQGGNHMSRLWYRPAESCLMGGRNGKAFCAPCREQHVLRLCQQARPAKVKQERLDADHVRLTADTSALPGQPEVRWIRNGTLRGTGATFDAKRSDSPWGESELVCEVRGRTAFVRKDSQDWTTWRLTLRLDKGYAWDKGLKVEGPWQEPRRVPTGEGLGDLFGGVPSPRPPSNPPPPAGTPGLTRGLGQ